LLNSEHINPDIKWYTSISNDKGISFRCPYATVEKCPRYYSSLSLLGKSGVSTKIKPGEDDLLKSYWERTEFWPVTGEQDTGISGSDDKHTGFHNFCPEATYLIFNLFASHLSDYHDPADREYFLSHYKNEDTDDWRWNWAGVTPMHYSECDLYSMLLNRADKLEPLRKHYKTNNISALDKIELLCNRFQWVVKVLDSRYKNRQSIKIEDEYDVQYMLNALLSIYFDDVRPEEYTPSFAGSCSRIDFLLKEEKIGIEVKKTRKGLEDKKISEQLIIDINRYKIHQDCKTLICFVYDPEHFIKNPSGIINDLSGKHNELEVKVIISSGKK